MRTLIGASTNIVHTCFCRLTSQYPKAPKLRKTQQCTDINSLTFTFVGMKRSHFAYTAEKFLETSVNGFPLMSR